MGDFKVIPAIELRGGMALRYESVGMGTRANRVDALSLAGQLVEAGAGLLHVYNLDGPFFVSGAEHSGSVLAGAERNLTVMGEMARSLSTPVQISGGVRDLDSFKHVVQLGISRACLGSAAMRDPELVRQAVKIEPDAVGVFLDVRDGRVVSQDWIDEPVVPPARMAAELREAGVRHFIYQDIAADATDEGPQPVDTAEIGAAGAELIVTGGVKTLEHIRSAAATNGVTGVLVGKPLLLGKFTFEQALEAARKGLTERA